MLHPGGAKSYMLALPRSGNMHKVGSIDGQRVLQDCAPQTPAAGWGEVLVPTHRWVVPVEGKQQEWGKKERNMHFAFLRARLGGS